MKKNGFVYIVVLLVLNVICISVLYLSYLFTLQSSIIKLTPEKIQSKYLCQDKFNKFFYGKDNITNVVEPVIYKNFRTNEVFKEHEFLVDLDPLEDKDSNNKIIVKFEERQNRMNIVVDTKTKYKGIETTIQSQGTIFNELFELEETFLSELTLDDRYIEDFKLLIEDISENIMCDNTLPNSIVQVFGEEGGLYAINNMKNSTKKEILYIDDEIEKRIGEFNSGRLIFSLKTDENTPGRLEFRSNGELNKTIRLTGLIYIEGDIIVEENVEFNGIIVMNNGKMIVDEDKNIKINGLLLRTSDEEEDMDLKDIDLKYDRKSIYLMGSYLPSFLDINIDLIKIY